MSSKFIGNATADGRIWLGGVEWQVEVEFDVDEADLNIQNVHFVGWYNGDLINNIDPIPVQFGEWDEHHYSQLESIVDLWLSEFGYDDYHDDEAGWL